MNLNEVAKTCLNTAIKSGFSPNTNINDLEEYKYYLATKIALIHSEASEMLEALRVDDFDNMVEEAVDVLIRTLEYLSCLKGVDIDFELKKKMSINSKRKFRHGGKII